MSEHLPEGWRLIEARTLGGLAYGHVEHECGHRLGATARLADALDHVCERGGGRHV